MSLVPEYIIQQMLVGGINKIRHDRRILDVLFRNLRQSDLEDLWTFIRENSFDIAINYPDEVLKLPGIVILLRSENETDEFLSDLMQGPGKASVLEAPFAQRDTVGSVTQVGETAPRLLMDETNATGGTSTTVSVAVASMPLFDPFEEEAHVVLVRGTGAGQTRRVLGVTPVVASDTLVSVTPAWDTIPDATTVFKITGDTFPIVGEPSKVFEPNAIVTRVGSHYQAQYQLMLAASQPELVIYLYMIVKALVFLSTSFLIRNGFHNIKISGTDYLPKSEYLPDQAYQRSLLLEFGYSFDVFHIPEFEFDLGVHEDRWVSVQHIKSSIDVHDPKVQDPNDPERVVLESTLDL